MGFLHVLCNSWVIAFVTYIVVAVSTSYTSLYINLVLFLFHAREFTSSLVNNAERGWEADLSLKIKETATHSFKAGLLFVSQLNVPFSTWMSCVLTVN